MEKIDEKNEMTAEMNEAEKKVEMINYQAELQRLIDESGKKYQIEFKKLAEVDPTIKQRWIDSLEQIDRDKIDHMLDFFLRMAKQGQEQELLLDDFLTTYRKRYKEAVEAKLGDTPDDDDLIDAWLNFHEDSIRRGVEIKMASGMKQMDAIVAELSALQPKTGKSKKDEKIEEPIVDPVMAELAPPKIEPPKKNPVVKFFNDTVTKFNDWINELGGKKK